jgi:four helix bundle protein
MAAKSFEDLLVWRKAHEFVLGVYRYTATFPAAETYGLRSQFRRAAVSIPANIAEGFRRRRRPDKARMLNIAQASLEECRYYLILAADLRYGTGEDLLKDLQEVSKMLNAYCSAVLEDARLLSSDS